MGMKLDAVAVQQVRALYAAGFSTRSIAQSFDLSHRQIWSIVSGKAWQFLPVQPVELPTFPGDAVTKLRLRSAKRLTAEQRQQLEQYRVALSAAIDDQADREARAIHLMHCWTPRRARPKKKEFIQ